MSTDSSEDGFQIIADILEGKKDAGSCIDQDFRFSCYKRLIKALNPPKAGTTDIASLIRQVLRLEQELQGGGRPRTLKVPKGASWPTVEDWQRSNIEIDLERASDLVVHCKPWSPTWMKGVTDKGLDDGIMGSQRRRVYAGVPGDPFLKEFGHDNYTCSGQREAIRSILTMPNRATLAVNLPTGSGKSLCAHLPAFMASHESKTTVVVVPTVSLSIDQEAELTGRVPHPCSYYAASDDENKLKNQEIRQRILDGTQKIVFTSPEALQQSLKGIICKAAERDLIKALVIDEAHIVSDWGDGFRPAFQSIAGLREYLLSLSPLDGFPTILLSATFTSASLDLLKRLFGAPGPFKVISANILRPEPTYWSAYCWDSTQKEVRLLEALRNLPRPIVVYTTKVDDANHLTGTIKDDGISRIDTYTGPTNPRRKRSLSDRWRNMDIDIMVATSAFGLGINQSDVRTIVHACMPETVDRYYQEVGRGGRDGNASMALMLYTQTDIEIAGGMSKETLIGADRGWQRWSAMFNNNRPIKDESTTISNTFSVPIDIPPSLVNEHDINMTNTQNRNWHLRTLALMVRANLIKWSLELPTQREIDQVNAKSGDDESEDLNRQIAVVTIEDNLHLVEEHWKECVENARQSETKIDKQAWELFRKLIEDRDSRCMAEVLSDAYELDRSQGGVVPITLACGGCAFCRSRDAEPYSTMGIAPTPIWEKPRYAVGPQLNQIITDIGSNLINVFHEPGDDLSALIGNLISQGINQLIGPRDLVDGWLWDRRVQIQSRPVFTNEHLSSLSDEFMRVPTVYYCPHGSKPDLRDMSQLPVIVKFYPHDAHEHNRPESSLRSTLNPAMDLGELKRRLGL